MRVIREASLVLLGGLGLGLALIIAFNVKKVVLLAILGGSGLLAGLIACGNPRLLILWSAVIIAPLDLSKKFFPVAHMGGAGAIRIDAVDVFLFVLIIFFIRDYIVGYRRKFSFPLPAVLWLIFVAFGLYTVAFGPYRKLAILEIFRELKLLLLLLIIMYEASRVQRFEHIAGAIMTSVTIQSLIAMVQFVLKKPLGLQALGEVSADTIDVLSQGTLESGEFVFRVSALIGHANLFSTFIASQTPIALALLFTRIPMWLKVLCTIALGTGGIAMIMTLSRTGWVTMGAALAGVMILSLFHPRLRAQFVLGRVCFVVAVLGIGLAFSGKIMDRIFKSDKGAVDIRWELLDVAWAMTQSSPLTGVGLNSFVFQMAPFSKYGDKSGMDEKFGEVWPVAHNVYAIIIAEQGFIGITLFFIFLCSLIWVGLKNLKIRDERIFAVNLGCLAGLGAFILDWLASFSLKMDNMGRVFFLVMAMMLASYVWRQANELEPMQRLKNNNASDK